MAVPRVQLTITPANLASVRRVERASENDAGDRVLTAVKQLNLQKVDPADKSKLGSALEPIQAPQGQVFVTVVTEQGTKLALVDGRQLAAAKKPGATSSLEVTLVSEALSDAAVAELHSVDSHEAQPTISE